MNQNYHRKLICGSADGPANRLLLLILKVPAFFYRLIIIIRNFAYDKGILRSYKADVPVISIGNITAGGTGKTPLVIWLCSALSAKSIRCDILTRGYKSAQGTLSDEPAVLAKSCPSCHVIVNPDRIAGAQRAISQYHSQVLVMDDGFQHRRLKRDLDIIAIDSTCPFGFGRLLPAGLLREPLSQIKRAHAAVLTRCDQVNPQTIADIEKQITDIKPGIIIAKTIHRHTHAQGIGGKIFTLDELKAKRIFVFCGIANPDAFLNQLKKNAFSVIGSRVYNDHHAYTLQDADDIYEQAKYLNADFILTTQKDWVKTALLLNKKTEIIFAYLAVVLEFIEGSDKILALVEEKTGLAQQEKNTCTAN